MYNILYHGEKDLSLYSFLVTGGAGFIGSNLVAYLLKYGAGKVRVLDNFSTGSMRNLEGFSLYNSFELIEGDIRNPEDCKLAVEGIDFVLHQAALGSVPRSVEDPLTTNDVNITGFLNMLIASKDAGVKRLIYAASSSTYGDENQLPMVEDKIGKPLSPYAITKYVDELYADVFSRLYETEYIGLRYFNVFGRGQNPESTYAAVIPKFISMLLAHESPVINGDGKISRDFTYIENVIQANIMAVLSDNQEAVNQIYNVACGEQTSLNELAILLRDTLALTDHEIANLNFIYGKARKGDIPHSLASIKKAEKFLRYYPYFDLKAGLKETVEAYIEEYKSV
jgi:UDP-N-acetylglucosamine 4-epimerase